MSQQSLNLNVFCDPSQQQYISYSLRKHCSVPSARWDINNIHTFDKFKQLYMYAWEWEEKQFQCV